MKSSAPEMLNPMTKTANPTSSPIDVINGLANCNATPNSNDKYDRNIDQCVGPWEFAFIHSFNSQISCNFTHTPS